MKRQILGYVGLLGLWATLNTAHAADFAGAGTGLIPDDNPTGINITFNVSGFTQPLSQLALRLEVNHTYVNDLRATLISPSGTVRMVVFSRMGFRASVASETGLYWNLSGTYQFDDSGADLWAAFTLPNTGGIVPSGVYRPSTAGGVSTEGTRNDHGGCSTSFAKVFGGLEPADTNGTWTLYIADVASADVGSVSSAMLSILDSSDALYRSGFDPALLGTCKRAWLDLTGSGRTSYVVTRNTGGGPSGAITWFVKDNNSVAGGATTSFQLGIASDFFITGDWDGDGIGDAAIWRAGNPGQFIIRPSSRPTRLITQPFGQAGDDPRHDGDYDGDRRTDFAVFRAGATSGAVSRTLIELSGGGPDRNFVTGENGTFPSGGVDYTGDGIADMAVQANAGSGVASFRIFNGITGTLANSFNFGGPTDVIVTGNHTGNAIADVTTIRASAGQINWTTRDGSTGIGQPSIVLGVSSTDFTLSGDYDGDGLDDYAVWRPSATAGQSNFIVRRSANPGTPIEIPLGNNADYPVGNSRSH